MEEWTISSRPFYKTGGDIEGMAAKVMSIEELHRRMDHILPEAARCLVSKRAIEGIKIDKSTQLWSCDCCEYAKATRKSITKIHEMPRASKFGKEIDLDL